MSRLGVEKFPFQFRNLSPEEKAKLEQNFGAPFEFVRVGPKGYLLSANYKHDAENIYNMPLRDDDIIVYSFPRSGTTWTQELVWLIMNNLDFEAASSMPLTMRLSSIFTEKVASQLDIDINSSTGKVLQKISQYGSELLASCPSPRFIKTHLSLSFLPPGTIDTAKVIYVARDPRDVAVSYYHHNRMFKHLNYKGDFKTYWDLFQKDLVLWAPYFEHLKEAWALRHHHNMLFLFYEELSKDFPTVVRVVAQFLNKQLTDKQVADLCDYLSFENFKTNDSVNYSEFQGHGLLNTDEKFIRKGITGGWREYFDEQMSQEAERWMTQHLQDSDLRFPHLH